MECAVYLLVLHCLVLVNSGVMPDSASSVLIKCHLDPFPNGYYDFYGNQNGMMEQTIPVGKFVTAKCNPGYRLIGDDRVECDVDGHLRNQAVCQDINECNLFTMTAGYDKESDYSILSINDVDYSLSSINDVDNSSPDNNQFPCIEPASCINTDGSFLCHCRHRPVVPCQRFLQCSELSSPEHAYVIEQTEVHVVFGCEHGYKLSGSEMHMCVEGSWDGEQTLCQVSTCQPPPATIENGWSDVENRVYSYGEEVHYGCNNGSRLVGGNSWRICSADNHWTSRTPSCQAIRCPDPGQILHGQALLFSRDIGGTVRYRCESGNFQLLGSPERVCQPNGKWSGPMTTCNDPATSCPTPVVPFNGVVTGSSSYDLDDVITIKCNYGYDLIGSKHRRCTASGQWSGDQTICRAIGEFDDIEEVGRRLVETTDLLRDGVQIQRLFTEAYNLDENNLPISNDAETGGRLVMIPSTGASSTKTRGLDVYFVFDISESVKVGKKHKEAIDFAKAFVTKVGVSASGVGGTRYGAVAYASKATVVFQLDMSSVEEVHSGLDSILNENQGEGTATSKALNLIHTNIIPHTEAAPGLKGKRTNADKVLFLLTDGQSNMNGSPDIEATTLKDRFDVGIHCIGIGSEVNRDELKKIASVPDNEYVFMLENFKPLEYLTFKIIRSAPDYSICGESNGPRNTESSDSAIQKAEDVWPWHAGIYLQKNRVGTPSYFCGGTLIAPKWILSAAHCFDPRLNSISGRNVTNNIVVYMGINKRIERGDALPERAQNRYVKRIISHELYDFSMKPTFDYDIALLELESEFTLDAYVRTVCLPPTDDYESLMATGGQNKPYATGFGKEQYDDQMNSVFLKQIALPIKSSEDRHCKVKQHEEHGNLTERMFCAGYSDGRADTCQGDSGGPLVRRWSPRQLSSDTPVDEQSQSSILEERWYQVGIISWGPTQCSQPGQYGYYTNLPYFVPWLQDNINSTLYS